MSEPITEGKMQVNLEAALEQIGGVSWALRALEAQHGEDATKQARYHLKAVEGYVTEVVRAMQEKLGSTEGQLCPYEDCAHDLAFQRGGWWTCPHCKRLFYADSSDGDFEDFHCRIPGEKHTPADVPDSAPEARDLGPSWATPEQAKDGET